MSWHFVLTICFESFSQCHTIKQNSIFKLIKLLDIEWDFLFSRLWFSLVGGLVLFDFIIVVDSVLLFNSANDLCMFFPSSLSLSLCLIGNGPSGITLSYMLAGNWPYWNPQDITKHPDELLRARLSFADSNKSLVQQDLIQLAEGLEGRSTNPVSLLVSVQHRCAMKSYAN